MRKRGGGGVTERQRLRSMRRSRRMECRLEGGGEEEEEEEEGLFKANAVRRKVAAMKSLFIE